MQRQTQLANELWPLLLPKMTRLLAGIGDGAGGGGVAAHELGGGQHKGVLRDDQAPQFLLRNGLRSITGNLGVEAGITIDGVDISAHASDPDAHHPRAHVLATNTALGPDHTISGAAAGWVLRATASNAARMMQLLVTDLGASGASWDVVSLTAANTVGLRTPSSDVRTGAAEAYLKSNAAGELALKGMALGSAMVFAGNNTPAAGPHLQFASTGLIAAAGGLYINIDSDNTSSSNALIVQHDADTSAGEELLRLTESGWLSVLDRVRVPLIDTASGSLRLEPADSIYLTPGASNRVYLGDGKALRTVDFASGFAGYGFQLDQGITSAGKTTLMLDDLTVRGRMSVYELLIRQIRATNGSVFVTSTAKVKRVSPVTGGYRLYTTEAGETPTATTDHAHGFLSGDLLRAQRTRWDGATLVQIYRSDLRVTTVDDLYTFRAVLEDGDISTPGMEFVRIGSATDVNRRGSIYLTADDDSAPFMDVVDGIASHSDWNTANKIKVRLGKLTGITTVANEYGIIAGAGGFADADQWIKASSAGVRLNNTTIRTWLAGVQTGQWLPSGQLDIGFDGVGTVATRDFTVHETRYVRIGRQTTNYPNLFYSQANGYVALRSGTTDKIRFNDDGSSFFAGIMTIGTAGEIRQGTGALGTDYTGLRVWRDGGIGRIAGYNNNVIQWSADTDGIMRAGAGAVELRTGGINIKAGAATTGNVVTSENRLNLISSLAPAQTIGWIGAAENSFDKYVDLRSYGPSNQILLLSAETTVAGKVPEVQISATNSAGQGSLISIGATDLSFYVSSPVAFRTSGGGSYQQILVNQIAVANGYLTSNNAFQFWRTDGTAFQQLRANSLMLSNDGSHYTRVPANGIYSLGAVAVGVTALTAGYLLDVGGAAYIRNNGRIDGAWYFAALVTAPGVFAGYLPVWFDSATQTLKARLPGGTIRTISWV